MISVEFCMVTQSVIFLHFVLISSNKILGESYIHSRYWWLVCCIIFQQFRNVE